MIPVRYFITYFHMSQYIAIYKADSEASVQMVSLSLFFFETQYYRIQKSAKIPMNCNLQITLRESYRIVIVYHRRSALPAVAPCPIRYYIPEIVIPDFCTFVRHQLPLSVRVSVAVVHCLQYIH